LRLRIVCAEEGQAAASDGAEYDDQHSAQAQSPFLPMRAYLMGQNGLSPPHQPLPTVCEESLI
jgi:hypothetical protein